MKWNIYFLILLSPLFFYPRFCFAGDSVIVSTTHEGEGYALDLKVDDVGEPIGQPIRMTMNLRCYSGEGFRKIPLLTRFPVCDYKSYKFVKEKHQVSISYLEGVYNPQNQSVFCQSNKVEKFNLKKRCLDSLSPTRESQSLKNRPMKKSVRNGKTLKKRRSQKPGS